VKLRTVAGIEQFGVGSSGLRGLHEASKLPIASAGSTAAESDSINDFFGMMVGVKEVD
jgi:hypothetical protein